jgi:DNA-binding CsgD family transcriptional regulator
MFDTDAHATLDERPASVKSTVSTISTTNANSAASPRAPRPSPWALAASVLEASAQAIAVLDAAGGLIYWNAEAQRRLGKAGWTLHGDCLRAASARDGEALTRAAAQVCGAGRVCLVNLRADGSEIGVLKPMAVDGQRYATLVLGREALCGELELQIFASHSELTWAEARVLHRLAQGLRPAQIARENGVALTTVLSQVAALRAKSRCPSINDLLARLARLPAVGRVQ